MKKDQISAVKRDENGKIQRFQTKFGRELSYADAIKEIEDGYIEGVQVVREEDGETYIRSNPDLRTDNNLEGLPMF